MPTPIRAVIFDFHQTLVDGGDAAHWLDLGWSEHGLPGDPASGLGADHARVVEVLDTVWTHAAKIDPDSRRDLSPDLHRDVTVRTLAGQGVDPALAATLHRVMLDRWFVYDDALPTVRALHEAGVRVAVLSNIGMDVRPMLRRAGLLDLIDAVVLSYEIQAVKPDAAAFQATLDALGATAEETLMVGDAWTHDGAAAALGMRTLILPRTRGRVRGLGIITGLVSASAEQCS